MNNTLSAGSTAALDAALGINPARSEPPTFEPWPKIGRLKGCGMVVTEKLDGTNAQVYITEDGRVYAGSRTRWLQPGKGTDNFGFAAWVAEHEDELRCGLGPGRHFGEWWGLGIQRGYGLAERRFSLFNTHRWSGAEPARTAPACCHVVPVLARGEFTTDAVERVMADLASMGSHAAPAYMNPEGVVVWLSTTRTLFKRTFVEGAKG